MIKPKKSLSQNFLIDKNISKKIVNLTKITNDIIIEIGPGTGNLKDEIIKNKPKKLVLIEKDKSLYSLLKKKYNNDKKIELINIDVLDYDFDKIKVPFKIISNLPYNISTKIIFKILKLKINIIEMIFMIQKEVAKKMYYKNNIKKNRLNCFIAITSNYHIEFDVSKNVFFPKPKVDSTIVKIIPKKNNNYDLYKFEEFTRKLFNNKRKKISFFIKKNKLNKNKLDINVINKRAEDLKIEEILEIFNQFYI